MEGAGHHAEQALERVGGVDPTPRPRLQDRGADPADGTEQTAPRLRRRPRHLEERRQPRRVPELQRQGRGGEQLARLAVPVELGRRDLEADLARHPQPVQVGLDPLLEAGQVAGGVVGRVDGLVAEQPEESRLLGVLLDDVEEDAAGADAGRGHQLSCTEPPLILFTPVERLKM